MLYLLWFKRKPRLLRNKYWKEAIKHVLNMWVATSLRRVK